MGLAIGFVGRWIVCCQLNVMPSRLSVSSLCMFLRYFNVSQ